MKSLKEQADPNCTTCKGSGQDTTTTGYTGVCECVGLHDAGIEPSGQGEEAIVVELNKQEKELIKNEADNRYSVGLSLQRNTFRVGAQWGILHERQQTALLSRQLLRSEQKNRAKDEEIQRLREALEEAQKDIYTWADEPEKAIRLVSDVIDQALNPSPKTDKS